MTIPALLKNTNNLENKSGWKEAFSILNQADLSVMNNDGSGSMLGLISNSDSDMIKNLFKPYLSIIKECNSSTSNSGCWHSPNHWYVSSGSAIDWGDGAAVVLKNGMIVRFSASTNASNCSEVVNGINICGDIKVDVNGFKLPNTIGKDIFSLLITANKLVPDNSIGNGFDESTNVLLNN